MIWIFVAKPARGLRLGVAPIGVTHGSIGDYALPAWHAALAVYRGKWPLPFGVRDDAIWPEATSSTAPNSADADTEPAATEPAAPSSKWAAEIQAAEAAEAAFFQ